MVCFQELGKITCMNDGPPNPSFARKSYKRSFRRNFDKSGCEYLTQLCHRTVSFEHSTILQSSLSFVAVGKLGGYELPLPHLSIEFDRGPCSSLRSRGHRYLWRIS